ncbi:hypothetical protein [Phycicoccus flavus]|uniref:Uncharacterized protein n=1 Tax=Phycicoccus flavus TaxID=2502783 RepID=A0A8T6R8M5_9MICO|nr:hypothetical protein [Phycicoccus flavus]NHA69883.1 hypothetical protein [Phycicoccus flavus]
MSHDDPSRHEPFGTPPGSGRPPHGEPGPGDRPGPQQDPYGGYSAAPPPQNPYGGAPAAAPAGPVTRPRSMDLAVLLMRVGAGLTLLSLLFVFTASSEIRTAIQDGMAESGSAVDPGTVDAFVALGYVVGTVFTVGAAAMWLWMAWANGKGRSWARIVATVLFGISLLFFLLGLLQAAPVLERLLGVVQQLVGLGAVVLMFRRESSEWYRAMSAPRY